MIVIEIQDTILKKINSAEMSVIGGVLRAKHTDVDVKNLIVESLQDKETLNQVGVNVGYGFKYGTAKDKSGNTISDNRNSVSMGVNLGNGDKLWVNEQSGIIGTESVKVNVEEKLSLIGGIIANIREDGTDGGNLTVSYGEIQTQDLHSYDNGCSGQAKL